MFSSSLSPRGSTASSMRVTHKSHRPSLHVDTTANEDAREEGYYRRSNQNQERCISPPTSPTSAARVLASKIRRTPTKASILKQQQMPSSIDPQTTYSPTNRSTYKQSLYATKIPDLEPSASSVTTTMKNGAVAEPTYHTRKSRSLSPSSLQHDDASRGSQQQEQPHPISHFSFGKKQTTPLPPLGLEKSAPDVSSPRRSMTSPVAANSSHHRWQPSSPRNSSRHREGEGSFHSSRFTASPPSRRTTHHHHPSNHPTKLHIQNHNRRRPYTSTNTNLASRSRTTIQHSRRIRKPKNHSSWDNDEEKTEASSVYDSRRVTKSGAGGTVGDESYYTYEDDDETYHSDGSYTYATTVGGGTTVCTDYSGYSGYSGATSYYTYDDNDASTVGEYTANELSTIHDDDEEDDSSSYQPTIRKSRSDESSLIRRPYEHSSYHHGSRSSYPRHTDSERHRVRRRHRRHSVDDSSVLYGGSDMLNNLPNLFSWIVGANSEDHQHHDNDDTRRLSTSSRQRSQVTNSLLTSSTFNGALSMINESQELLTSVTFDGAVSALAIAMGFEDTKKLQQEVTTPLNLEHDGNNNKVAVRSSSEIKDSSSPRDLNSRILDHHEMIQAVSSLPDEAIDALVEAIGEEKTRKARESLMEKKEAPKKRSGVMAKKEVSTTPVNYYEGGQEDPSLGRDREDAGHSKKVKLTVSPREEVVSDSFRETFGPVKDKRHINKVGATSSICVSEASSIADGKDKYCVDGPDVKDICKDGSSENEPNGDKYAINEDGSQGNLSPIQNDGDSETGVIITGTTATNVQISPPKGKEEQMVEYHQNVPPAEKLALDDDSSRHGGEVDTFGWNNDSFSDSDAKSLTQFDGAKSLEEDKDSSVMLLINNGHSLGSKMEQKTVLEEPSDLSGDWGGWDTKCLEKGPGQMKGENMEKTSDLASGKSLDHQESLIVMKDTGKSSSIPLLMSPDKKVKWARDEKTSPRKSSSNEKRNNSANAPERNQQLKEGILKYYVQRGVQDPPEDDSPGLRRSSSRDDLEAQNSDWNSERLDIVSDESFGTAVNDEGRGRSMTEDLEAQKCDWNSERLDIVSDESFGTAVNDEGRGRSMTPVKESITDLSFGTAVNDEGRGRPMTPVKESVADSGGNPCVSDFQENENTLQGEPNLNTSETDNNQHAFTDGVFMELLLSKGISMGYDKVREEKSTEILSETQDIPSEQPLEVEKTIEKNWNNSMIHDEKANDEKSSRQTPPGGEVMEESRQKSIFHGDDSNVSASEQREVMEESRQKSIFHGDDSNVSASEQPLEVKKTIEKNWSNSMIHDEKANDMKSSRQTPPSEAVEESRQKSIFHGDDSNVSASDISDVGVGEGQMKTHVETSKVVSNTKEINGIFNNDQDIRLRGWIEEKKSNVNLSELAKKQLHNDLSHKKDSKGQKEEARQNSLFKSDSSLSTTGTNGGKGENDNMPTSWTPVKELDDQELQEESSSLFIQNQLHCVASDLTCEEQEVEELTSNEFVNDRNASIHLKKDGGD
eukprot:scaffold92085_cov52-Attheya_sp.AAC.5